MSANDYSQQVSVKRAAKPLVLDTRTRPTVCLHWSSNTQVALRSRNVGGRGRASPKNNVIDGLSA